MKKILLSFLVLGMTIMPINASALEENKVVTIEYLDDGTIVETILEETPILLYTEGTKSGKKTRNYKNAAGKILYSVIVKGTFKYNGNTSSCKSAEVVATVSVADWKVVSKSASKSGNKAIGKATMKHYYNGAAIQTTYPSVTLSCDKNGKLS